MRSEPALFTSSRGEWSGLAAAPDQENPWNLDSSWPGHARLSPFHTHALRSARLCCFDPAALVKRRILLRFLFFFKFIRVFIYLFVELFGSRDVAVKDDL